MRFTGAENVVPGELEIWFNLRFSTESSVESLQSRIDGILKRHGLNFSIDQWGKTSLHESYLLFDLFHFPNQKAT